MQFTLPRLPDAVQWACAFLCMVLAPTASAQLKGDTYQSAKKKGSGQIVITHVEAPGFAVGPGNGPLKGICIDLMDKFIQYVKQKEGIQLNVTYKTEDTTDFGRFLRDVKAGSGGVFGLSNTTITEARKQNYRFSSPFITNIAMTLTNNKVPTLSNPKDMAKVFAGFTAVTVKGSTNEKNILALKKKYYPELKVVYVASSQEVVDRLKAGDKVLGNLDFTHYLDAVKNRKPIKRHPILDEKSEKFGVIMPKSNDWAPILSAFMGDYVGSIEYKKSIAHHLGQNALNFLNKIN